ncbi:MAG: penicillin-binding protein 1C [Candidatus Aminicenantes bacterium]|nr:penicillin-binding protein 1C [Candidatus Aminicenantes bacterium]
MKGKIVFALLLLALLFMGSLYIPYPRGKLSPAAVVSLRILDRNGTLLREIISSEGGRCRWVDLSGISPYVVASTIAAEDRFFFLHPGVNVFSIVSAAVQNIRKGEVISGASTLTQQLARNLYGRSRTLLSKLFETWVAVRLEKTLSKEEILAQYLNRVCYGNMTYGIEAASRLYFDKSAADLSLAEAAFLASLPRSPMRLNPYSHIGPARNRQRHILNRMLRLGSIGKEKWERALQEPLKVFPASQKFRAPHFCDYVLRDLWQDIPRSRATIHTTLDYSLQEKVEVLAANHLSGLESKRITNTAVVVLDNHTAEILVMVGSKDFFDELHDGQVNGALSRRQPGSALKPFTYGLGLERGMTAAQILEDREVHFSTPGGTYHPQNYDKHYHGPVRMRQALACSYNVPAVVLSAELGPDLLYQKLKETGFQSLSKNSGFYGLGLTLGSGEVTLLELVQAYASLARGGLYKKAEAICSYKEFEKGKEFFSPGYQKQSRSRRIFTAQTAYILTHMLSDKDARIPAFGYHSPLNLPFPCAAKTGTSKDCRDNWTVGYTPRYTVGVWVGNFDGMPMHNISGITGCGPLFRDVMLLLEKENATEAFPVPADIIQVRVCPLSGKRAAADCPGCIEEIFVNGTEPEELCSLSHVEIGNIRNRNDREAAFGSIRPEVLFPLEGDVFKMDPVLRGNYQKIHFKASVPKSLKSEGFHWLLNGKKLGGSPYPFSLSWELTPGRYRLQCTLIQGGKRLRSSTVHFSVLR